MIKRKIHFTHTLAITIALLVLFVAFSTSSPVFLTSNNLLSLLRQVTVLGVVASGMTFVAITGGVDLSVGAVISLVGVIIGLFNGKMGLNIWLSAAIAVFCAVLVGAINGAIIVNTNIAPMIATLGMSQVIEGISYTISGGMPQSLRNVGHFSKLGQGYVGPIPIPVIILFLVIAVSCYIIIKMYFGRYFYAIGGNSEAARLSGINTKLIKWYTFLLCGFFTGIGSLVMLARVNTAQPSTGIGYEMDVMTAVILGGVSMEGGTGSIGGTIVGVLIIGVLNNGLTLVGAGEYVKLMIKGAVLLLALCIGPVQKKIMATRAGA